LALKPVRAMCGAVDVLLIIPIDVVYLTEMTLALHRRAL